MPTLVETQLHTPGYTTWREGLHGFWEYNDLVLNDRRKPDHYHLVSIDGLSDAEIRDPRAPWPSSHGEIALTSSYGGKTIVFEGDIRAGNVAKMRDMEAHLRDAFAGLTEAPLYYRTQAPGWVDEFDDNQILGYTFLSGSTTLTETGSALVPTSLVVKNFVANDLKYGDVDVLGRFKVGTDISTLLQRLFVKWIDQNNWIVAGSSPTGMIIRKADVGIVTTLATSLFTWQLNTEYWIRVRIVGNNIWVDTSTEELDGWNEDDALSYTLVGADSTKYGAGVEGNCGIFWDPSDLGERLSTLRILPLVSTDKFVLCKKNSPVAIKEQQADGQPYRRFMVTLRASRPILLSTIVKRAEIASITSTGFGRFYDRTYDLVYTTPMSSDGSPITGVGVFTTIVNAGNFKSEPVYRIYGPITDPTIKNLTTGETIELAISVPEDDLIQLNSEEKTVTDSSGANVFGSVSSFTAWPSLAEGVNEFQVFASSWDTGAKVVVFWRDAWQA